MKRLCYEILGNYFMLVKIPKTKLNLFDKFRFKFFKKDLTISNNYKYLSKIHTLFQKVKKKLNFFLFSSRSFRKELLFSTHSLSLSVIFLHSQFVYSLK